MRLRKSVAAHRIRISIAVDRVRIAYDAKAPITVFIDQEPVKWKLTEGFVFYVSAQRDGDGISLTFRSDDSERITTYRTVDNDLMDNTIIKIPLLSNPIVYEQVYRRVN